MTLSLHGVGIDGSRPVAIGEAFMLSRETALAPAQIPAQQVPAELERLDAALACARRHLEEIRGQIPPGTPRHIAEFIDAHLLMMTDSALVDALGAADAARHSGRDLRPHGGCLSAHAA
jgi:phosphotransferase system enzyme I (PtsI)